MKRIVNKIALCAGALALLVSCSLDEVNTRTPVADTYYATEDGASDLVNSIYSYAQALYRVDIWALTDMGTDIWMVGGDGPKALNNYTFSTSEDYVTNLWNQCYRGITAANTLIGRADGIKAAQATVNDFVGQAKFLRAWFYHILVMQYGDVPLVVDEVKEVLTTATRVPVVQIYEQVIKDLQDAENLLPDAATQWGRPSRTAAQALLARVYLHAGQWSNAAVYAKKVIDSGVYSLEEDYAALWDPKNQKSKEFIWSIQGSANDAFDTERSWASSIFTVRYDVHAASYGMVRDIANGRPYRYFMPTRHFYTMLVDNMDWDSRFEKCFKWTWYVNDESKCKENPGAAVGDTAIYTPPFPVSAAQRERAKGRYRIEDINDYFNPDSPNGEETSGPREMFAQLAKWLDPTRVEVGLMSSLDIVAIRLGEMYLIAAEALMKDNKAAEGAEYINALHKRAAKSEALYEAHKVSAEDMTIDLILDERAFELAGECNRWVDLKRTGKLLELVRLYNVDARPNIQDKHLLRPIPTTMMDRVTNKDTFVQNPGY
ncbi:MAG: RagB/SusD family nutrient uptake outer membrane protein [Bacteroidales bacterium]|nr:RagB/SusD family nutrient uptake outer membrane protein [Bacteroidales bacterium]MBR1578117.1 RagB/SusD family nutrient uptake outer membrane protein [Bacteroidales bacterium]